MKETLFVFSSSRSLESFAFAQEGFLPPSLTLEEFFSQSLIVPNKTKAPLILQKILLAEVLKEFEFDDQEKQFLFFEYNFLGFLETSPFLLALFSEMFGSQVELEEISLGDIYGEYQDHLRVLEKIYCAYRSKLDELDLYDFPWKYDLFWDYLGTFGEIRCFIDGFLSRFEWEILNQIAQKIPLSLDLHIDEFNLPYFAHLSPALSINHQYTISLSSGEILSSKPWNLEGEVGVSACDLRIDECSVVIQRVQEWLKEGVDPDKIAIVLPKEDFAKFLFASDRGRNFNYAMGKQNDGLKKQLDQIFEHCRHLDGAVLFDQIRSEILKLSIQEKSKEKMLEIVAMFERNLAFVQSLEIQEILELLFYELKKLREDDHSGGKVKVIGVLETRGVKFERVIVVDFNEDNIPSLSFQDMFLNTQMRQNLGMPTLRDKQNLQKHYYLELFKNTQKIELTYLRLGLSSFLKEAKIPHKIEDNRFTLFAPAQKREYVEDKICAKVGKDFVFSSTSLRAFQECRRKFYFLYLRKLKEEKKQEVFLGQKIHQLLYESYRDTSSIQEARKLFEQKMFAWKEESESMRFGMELDLAVRKMQKFWSCEMSCPPDEILYLEHSFDLEWHGVKWNGRIDRIDRVGDVIRVIDYKFTDHASSDVIQGAIYAHYVQDLFPYASIETYLMPLKNGNYTQVDVQKGEEKVASLICEVLQEESFDKTHARSHCTDCSFRVLCNR